MLKSTASMMLLLMLILANVSTYGDPQISGVSGQFQEGGALTVSGTGFGTKSQPVPLLWKDFEDSQPGAAIVGDRNTQQTENKGWTYAVGNITYADGNNLPGSLLCSRHDMSGCDTSARTADLYWVTDANLKRVFVSFWAVFDWGIQDPRHSMKLWRLSSSSDDYVILKDQHWSADPIDPKIVASHYYTLQVGDGYPLTDNYYGHIQSPPVKKWYRIEIQAEQSSTGVADGSISIWHGGLDTPMVNVLNLRNVITTHSYLWNTLEIGEYCANTPGCPTNCEAVTYFDDVYLDNSWARVVIGNAATYEACTNLQTQVPSAWSNTSITVTGHTGFLPYGTAYLYVVDSNGVRNSAGYPITVARSPKWLASVVDRWQAGKLTRDDLNKAVYWYMKGTTPPANPMTELTEEDITNAIKLAGQ
ncbi:hypothetical protein HZA56_10865 [Candidatus Poribacteria bacterium]|nr:hypothetical protein [Candidatus Poribacteria bacterium]